LGLPYTWWYFDSLAVFWLLFGLEALLAGKDTRAGLALAVGFLIKIFPVLALAVAWRFRPSRRAAWVTLLAIGLPALIYGLFYLASPMMTAASITSQGSKGSWETPWPLLPIMRSISKS
jgi:sterol desaturase/sphingolipid hydroxylase (fatty acid hydroxylase superfamily)